MSRTSSRRGTRVGIAWCPASHLVRLWLLAWEGQDELSIRDTAESACSWLAGDMALNASRPTVAAPATIAPVFHETPPLVLLDEA